MNSIFKYEKVLVILNSQVTAGDYLSFCVLLDMLKKNVKEVDLLIDGKINPALNELQPLPEVTKITEIEPQKVVLSFDKGDEKVENIQWHQTDDKINVYVAMKDGMFDAKSLQLSTEGSDYNAIIYLGVTNFEKLKQSHPNLSALVYSAENLSIGAPLAIPHTKVELVRGEKGELIGQVIFKSCQGKGATPRHYTNLLSSILLSGNRFKLNSLSASIFDTCSKLISNGARLDIANKIAVKAENIKQVEVEGRPLPLGEDAVDPLPPKQPQSSEDDLELAALDKIISTEEELDE